ncbi:hypothetical protein [Pedobacter sp. L105]|uniref:hypothetical protein n=1 Tax=Pedobacter sp. L105 TaxID=1641871 RepID=UPI00131C9153|nr:hypothetical protein [Pedobacter sp. L105]
MKEWNDFYVAVTGAAAALTGLIFVGISINLKDILETPILTVKASVSLILLLSILIFSILLLVPQTSFKLTGIEFTVLGMIVWGLVTKADLRIYTKTIKDYKKHHLLNLFIDQLAVLPYVGAGILMLLGLEKGVYLIVPSIMISFIKSVFDAWVLLIEIKR